MDNDIYSLVRDAETNFIDGTVKKSKYVEWSMHEEIETVEAYSNSKHLSGDTDALGREKPFYNIVTAAANIWYRATDIDRKDISIKATNTKSELGAFALNILLKKYMREENFGVYLNKWGRTLAKFGSAVSKIVEKDGRLCVEVIPWTRLIVDAVDFHNNPIIEKIYMTPSQLAKSGYDKKAIKNLLEARSTRKLVSRERVDDKDDYIEIYEVHGELPLSYITGNEKDDNEYVQQMHVVSFMGDDENFTLYSGRETKSPYVLAHLIEEEGSTLAKGAVATLFNEQWMVNHSMKAIKDQLDLASKLIFQTSDPSFVGQNVYDSVDTGTILIHSPNQPLTQVANNSHDITSLQNFATNWNNNAKEITSTTDAMRGITPPSGTALGTVQITTAQGLSLFELMTENKGLALEELIREFIIPYLIKKVNNTNELSVLLEGEGIRKVDAMYIKSEGNRLYNEKAKKMLLSGQLVEGLDTTDGELSAKQNLEAMGNMRYFIPSEIGDTTWRDIVKDIEYSVNIEITNENSNKDADMKTLTSALQIISSNPNILQDPNSKMILSKLLQSTGVISPLELAEMNTQPTTQEVMPIGRT